LVAREELKAITRRMQRGRVASAKEGKSITKHPPYGYLRDENLRLYPDVETAWVVKKMFEMMCDGFGRQHIAQELDKLGIKPPNPRREYWSPSSVTAIIKNEVYIGNIIWGQTDYVKRNGKYVKKKNPRDKWIIKEDAHEPIVSRELFEKANRAHTGRWRPSTEAAKTLSNPLAGILKCGICGYTMLYQPRKDRPNDVIRCSQSSCKGKQKGSSLSIVEERVINILAQTLNYIEEESKLEEDTKENEVPYKKILLENKESQLSELTNQKNKLHDFLEQGVYDIDTFMERQQNLAERINNLKAEINNLLTEIQKDELREFGTKEFEPVLRKVVEAYKEAETAKQKNELLKEVIEKATYFREKEWKERDHFELDLTLKVLAIEN
jgi:hypothetical protein